MPSGQAQTTWFPELKKLLLDNWNTNLTISEQFILVGRLNDKLNQIRSEGNFQPPIIWCPNCQKRHRSRFIKISITAVYFALKRFEMCTDAEFKDLRKKWNIYSKVNNIDIYGNITSN